MKRLPRNLDWLRISIALRPAAQQRFCLAVAFHNQSEVNVILPFSNAARKAEFFGLLILDRNDCRVEPTRNLHIRPAGDELEVREIAPHGCWEYVLDGALDHDTLHFPGANYSLQPQQTYKIQFQYQNAESNTVYWNFPPSENASVTLVERQKVGVGEANEAA